MTAAASSRPPSYGGYTSSSSPGYSHHSAASSSSSSSSLVPPPPLVGGGSDRPHHHQYVGAERRRDLVGGGDTGATTATATTPQLQNRLASLRSQSSDLSSELTRRLATSRSGQSLLHIGPSLSTLPPDLSSLLEALSPLLRDVSSYEASNRTELKRVMEDGRRVRTLVGRRAHARECAEMYAELVRAEGILGEDAARRMAEEHGLGVGSGGMRGGGGGGGSGGRRDARDEAKGGEGPPGRGSSDEYDDDDECDDDDADDDDGLDEELDHATSLERAAYTALYLLRELQSSTAEVSAIAMTAAPPRKNDDGADDDDDHDGNNDGGGGNNVLPSLDDDYGNNSSANGAVMEKSRFLVKLAPRIRRLEGDASRCLAGRLEGLLAKVRRLAEEGEGGGKEKEEGRRIRDRRSEVLHITVGHVLRGLALLGRGRDAESAFARVAVMPVVRSRLNVGRLDTGGSRGECAGLFFLLDDIANTVREMYGGILRLSEGMFARDNDYYRDDDDEDDDDVNVGGTGGGEEKDEGGVVDGASSASAMEVDLVTCGVWVPVATALMADPGMKLAIFSPGIANVLQANYSALDTFLSELASVLLSPPPSSGGGSDGASSSSSTTTAGGSASGGPGDFSRLYYRPALNRRSFERAQSRLYAHPATVEYYRRWNLPIYYQLRFAEFTRRIDDALRRVREEGWHASVYAGGDGDARAIRDSLGFELPIFVELYDVLLSMWRSTVFLRPLTHRFLRGAVQLVGRMLAFVQGGLEGDIEFGGSVGGGGGSSGSGGDADGEEKEEGGAEAATLETTIVSVPPYRWNERVEDIAVVSWELTILDTTLSHDYLEAISNTVCPRDEKSRQSTHNSTSELDEIKLLASDIMLESSRGIAPLVSHSWNTLIVDNLTSQCCAPLSAVKGVAATYRMTNRPPPTQASPFVATILRPLQEFDKLYASRTPPQIGDDWKRSVVSSVSDKYSLAVEELIATVKRTEDALKGRATRRTMAGGMSDGEKVKLQLFLDHREFKKHVEDLLGDAHELTWIEGLVKLGQLTEEAEELFLRTEKK